MLDIKVEQIKNEAKPYADTIIVYKIKIDGTLNKKQQKIDDFVTYFCTKFLTNIDKDVDSERIFYEPYYEIKKDSNREYTFVITSPFLD